MVAADNSPQTWDWSSTNTSRNNPIASVTIPSRSTVFSRVSSRLSGTAASSIATEAASNGTLLHQTHFHPRESVSTPPTIGPRANPKAAVALQIPIAQARRSGGNRFPTNDIEPGMMNAAPNPCRIRPATTHSALSANPMITEASAKNPTPPNKKSFRRPKMSPSWPPATTKAAQLSM